ncbi:MAG: ribonuclease Z [Tissierellia bacterium]|nr:ribonuclease Z [Tissierellia bacterium]
MIDITLLGTGGGMPMVNRFLSSTLLSFKGRKILLDCGEGTQVAMRKYKTGFKSIDIICITHFHGDHIFGLPGLLSTMGNSDRTEPVTIIGPYGLKKVLSGLLLSLAYLPYDIYIIEKPNKPLGIRARKACLEIEEIDDPNDFNGDIIMRSLELDHSCHCLGYSFYIKRMPKFLPEKAELNGVPKEIWKVLQRGETIDFNGKEYSPNMVLGEERRGIKLSYITDTRPIDAIIDFVSDSDLFICEGTYGDNEDLEKAIKNKHMTFEEAAKLALKAKVNELLLTHFSPSIDEPEIFRQNAIKIFPNTTIGHDGMKKLLNYK